MTDDELLKALGRAAREEDRASDPRWSARAQGTLAPGDRDALEAQAQRSAEDQGAWEASRPLDSEARSRIADRILAGLEADAGERGAETTGSPSRAQGTSAAGEGRVIPLPAKRGRAPWMIAAAALAAAAAALVFVRLSPEGDGDRPRGLLGDPGALALLPVPAYSVEVAGGELEQRTTNHGAGAPGIARLGPGSRLEIALRPTTRVEGPVAVRGFLIQGGTARPWDVRADVSEQGAARIEGDTETLFRGVPAGEWEIALAIGRPEALPSEPADVLRAQQQEAPRASALRLIRLKVLLLPRSAPPPATT
ncbi:hypothetical protein [Sorangium sp. So ce131]|uniref:hypothetical protein n=1 Tax=Sorangium sp. So ce131 TaxID=3133282 RepID=UPI003F61569A